MGPFELGMLMFGSNILSNSFTSQNQKQAISANQQLQKEQNEWNLNLWKLNNEYNLPINQVQRLKDAGFNPALMYGTNGSTGISASPAQGVNPARVNPLISPLNGVTDTIGSVFDRTLQQKIAQSNIVKNSADTTKSLADAAEAAANANRAGADTRKINYEIDNLLPSIANLNQSTSSLNTLKRNLITQQIDESKAKTSQIISTTNLNAVQLNLLQKQLSWYDKVQAANIYVDTLNAISSKQNADSNSLSAKSNATLHYLQSEGEYINNQLKYLFGTSQMRHSINEQVLRNKMLLKQLKEAQFGPLKISTPDYTSGLPYQFEY